MDNYHLELEAYLPEICEWLARILPEGYQTRVRLTSEANLSLLHSSLGDMLRGNCLQEGRKLFELFYLNGITETDEMVRLVIKRFHAYLQNAE